MKKVVSDVRKLTVSGGKTYYITIPYEMIRELGWKKGEKKTIRLEEKRIVVEDWCS
ncbi:MAG: AbrB/MazE/SpoVT family DNA-binding domain-containing protein [Candidatus Omnitrophica bacterium]|nr:AbrB/MazE/SpoVT family DNA-binding domain-containing protein [Candidatus Omnitrophota bacterium]